MMEEDIDAGAARPREKSSFRKVLSQLAFFLVQLRRRLPYLVWYDDELDIAITFSQDVLEPEKGIEQLWTGAFSEAEKIFKEMGIRFDVGMGFGGRDWEWDWSLSGPLSVRFRNRATRPERRILRPRCKLRLVA